VYIDWVIPCRYVEIHDNLGTIVGAGIDTFWVPELPAPVSVWMAVRLLAQADELDGEAHPVKNVIIGPDAQVLSDVVGEFGAEMDGARPDWLNGLMLATVVQFEAPAEGTYTFQHTIDESSASVPLHIVHGPEPDGG